MTPTEVNDGSVGGDGDGAEGIGGGGNKSGGGRSGKYGQYGSLSAPIRTTDDDDIVSICSDNNNNNTSSFVSSFEKRRWVISNISQFSIVWLDLTSSRFVRVLFRRLSY